MPVVSWSFAAPLLQVYELFLNFTFNGKLLHTGQGQCLLREWKVPENHTDSQHLVIGLTVRYPYFCLKNP